MCFCNSAVSAFCSANDVKNKRLVLCPSFVSLPLVVCVCARQREGETQTCGCTQNCVEHTKHTQKIFTPTFLGKHAPPSIQTYKKQKTVL